MRVISVEMASRIVAGRRVRLGRALAMDGRKAVAMAPRPRSMASRRLREGDESWFACKSFMGRLCLDTHDDWR